MQPSMEAYLQRHLAQHSFWPCFYARPLEMRPHARSTLEWPRFQVEFYMLFLYGIVYWFFINSENEPMCTWISNLHLSNSTWESLPNFERLTHLWFYFIHVIQLYVLVKWSEISYSDLFHPLFRRIQLLFWPTFWSENKSGPKPKIKYYRIPTHKGLKSILNQFYWDRRSMTRMSWTR